MLFLCIIFKYVMYVCQRNFADKNQNKKKTKDRRRRIIMPVVKKDIRKYNFKQHSQLLQEMA